MSLSNNLVNQKLGLGYLSSAFANAGYDNLPHPNTRIRDYEFDVINLGTLKKPVPTAVLRKNIFSDTFLSRRNQDAYKNIIIKNDKAVYETITELNFSLYGDYTYFAPYKIRFRTLDTSFFQDRLLSRETIIKDIDKNLPFTRLQFPQNLSNTTRITGLRSSYNPANIQKNILTSNFYISGYNSGINYDNRNTFLYQNFGTASGYIPYPNSVVMWQYPVFNLDTKIALDSVYAYDNMYKDMQGLLLASLRSPSGSEQVVYISPHDIKNKIYNSIIDNVVLRSSRIQTKVFGRPPRFEYVQVNSGISVNVLDIGSEYVSGNQNIFQTGIVLNTGTGIEFLVQNNLQQTTPLKDTWYYKFYSGLYAGNKTIATGTWNGVIPSGYSIVLEYVTTKDGRMGTDNQFKFIYKNYGDGSYIDQSIRNTFKNSASVETSKTLINPQTGTFIIDPLTGGTFNVTPSLNTNVSYNRALEYWKSLNDSNYSGVFPILKRGFGVSYVLRESIDFSNTNLRKNINLVYSQKRKELPSGISIYKENYKARRFRNLKSTNNYDYISKENIPSGVFGCFKMSNKQIVCVDSR